MLGNTLFVAELGSNRVGAYNSATGAAINANFITGLKSPTGLAVMAGTQLAPESFLFVANNHSGTVGNSGTVGKYDAKTGAVINASFISGLNRPFWLAVRR